MWNRKDNQSLYSFGNNDTTIPNQNIFGPITEGNIVKNNSNADNDTKAAHYRKKIKAQQLKINFWRRWLIAPYTRVTKKPSYFIATLNKSITRVSLSRTKEVGISFVSPICCIINLFPCSSGLIYEQNKKTLSEIMNAFVNKLTVCN